MTKALKGVAEKERVMPPGVVNVGGEVYYVENQPGQGVELARARRPGAGRRRRPPKTEPDGSTPAARRASDVAPDPARPATPKYEDPRDRTFGT